MASSVQSTSTSSIGLGPFVALFLLLSACDQDGTGARAELLREKLVRTLKDPDSAKFRDDKMNGLAALCGEVNAKNSMGGYTGFSRFVVTLNRVLIDGDPPIDVWDGGEVGSSAATELVQIWTAFLKEANDAPETIGARVRRMSESEREAVVRKRYFQSVWASNCGRPG